MFWNIAVVKTAIAKWRVLSFTWHYGTLNVHDNFLVNSFTSKIESIFQQCHMERKFCTKIFHTSPEGLFGKNICLLCPKRSNFCPDLQLSMSKCTFLYNIQNVLWILSKLKSVKLQMRYHSSCENYNYENLSILKL